MSQTVWLAFVSALAVSLALVPMVRWLSFRTGRVAKPRKDRWHSQPTPTLGGVGIFLAFAGGMAVTAAINGSWQELRWGLLGAAGLMFLLGLVDDFKRLTPPVKLMGQMLAATIFIFPGEVIRFFPWPIANILLTYLWLVGITNAINLLDNMDGLAGGVALIAAGMLSFFFWRGGSADLLLIGLALAGGILGFLVFNFPPAKIFMGDSGSLFLGFTLAALAVARRSQASNVFAVVGVPTLLFLLPILDTTFVTVTRMLRGQSPAQGGTDHTSHRLIAFGLTERQAVLVLYGVALISGVAGAQLEALDYETSLVVAPILLIVLSLTAAYLGRLKVVTAATPNQTSLARLMGELTYRRRVFEIGLDLLLIGVSYYLGYWTRYGLDMTRESMDLFLRSWPLALGAAYIAFYAAGVYRGVWRYIGVDDILRYAAAVLGAVVLAAAAILTIYRDLPYSAGVFGLYGVILFLGLAGSRFSFQILDRVYTRQQGKAEKASVLLYGAEDAGELALRWLMRNPELGYDPAGFIDEDSFKWGRMIHGVPVRGGLDQMEKILAELQVQGVILSSLPEEEILESIRGMCQARGIWVKALRLELETLE